MKEQILIVDDNIQNLQVTAKTLREEDYAIILAQSGAAALTLLQKHKPSLILLDVMMPDMDGYETCAKIKAHKDWKEIPVVFLTAKDQTEDLVKGFQFGGVDYITKPFNRAELLVRVENHIALMNSKAKIVKMKIEQDKLYSIIAHDIRSPLAGILQTLDVISDGTIDPREQVFADIVTDLNQTTKKTLMLLNDLLQWTKLNGHEKKFEFTECNVNTLVQESAQLLKSLMESKNVELELALNATQNAFADQVSISTVFRNTLSNAIKFTNKGGEIQISTANHNNAVRITIVDDGVGMSAEVLDKILNKNEHHTTYGTNYEKGTGLGLPLIKQFVKQNKGELSISSQPNVGTTVTIELPTNE